METSFTKDFIQAPLDSIEGFLPLALQLGTGGEMLQPFAVTVISGLVGLMFFSLIVIPVLYNLFEK